MEGEIDVMTEPVSAQISGLVEELRITGSSFMGDFTERERLDHLLEIQKIIHARRTTAENLPIVESST